MSERMAPVLRYGQDGQREDTLVVQRLMDAVERMCALHDHGGTPPSQAWDELFTAAGLCYERWAERVAVLEGSWAAKLIGAE